MEGDKDLMGIGFLFDVMKYSKIVCDNGIANISEYTKAIKFSHFKWVTCIIYELSLSKLLLF